MGGAAVAGPALRGAGRVRLHDQRAAVYAAVAGQPARGIAAVYPANAHVLWTMVGMALLFALSWYWMCISRRSCARLLQAVISRLEWRGRIARQNQRAGD